MRVSNFKAILLLSAFVLVAPFAQAQAEGEEVPCYQKEIDPQTKRVYQNEAQWNVDQKKLSDATPRMPNFLRLKWGWDLSRIEIKKTKGIGSDKRKHCYVGCRIGYDIGHDVAVYAGYYKEADDITDCNIKTHFDLKDIDATILGADIAKKCAEESTKENPKQADEEYCRTECRAAIPR